MPRPKQDRGTVNSKQSCLQKVSLPITTISDLLDVVSDSPKRAKLLKNIKQDVERTHPEFDYFKDEATRSLMITVLFVHAKVSLFCSTLTVQVHPEYSYKQGMNELLAPIVFVLNQATQIVS